jgi:hypothetical protein
MTHDDLLMLASPDMMKIRCNADPKDEPNALEEFETSTIRDSFSFRKPRRPVH